MKDPRSAVIARLISNVCVRRLRLTASKNPAAICQYVLGSSSLLL